MLKNVKLPRSPAAMPRWTTLSSVSWSEPLLLIEVPKSLICLYPLCAISFIKLHLMSKLLWKPWLEIQSLAMMSSPPPPQRNVKERLLSLAKKKLPHCASSWINGISPARREKNRSWGESSQIPQRWKHVARYRYNRSNWQWQFSAYT